jgi:serine/threonine-protein kinase
MPDKLILKIINGPEKGKNLTFEEHDTLIFGRMDDCHVCLPEDTYLSRHHFILEILPPQARVRDLGSLNGTYVNGVKYGGRERHETPEQGALRQYPEVDLKDGDEIKVGETAISLQVDLAVYCTSCGTELPESWVAKRKAVRAALICENCLKEQQKKAEEARKPQSPPKPKPVLCQKCGRDVSGEVRGVPQKGYVCKKCQKEAAFDPGELLMQLLARMVAEGSLPPKAEEIKVPDYDIVRKLGCGGMGCVYLAKHKKTGQQVALKVMLSKVAVSDQARAQFKREIDNQRTLKHKNIAGFMGQGSVGSMFYFLQEFCSGGCVGSLMERRGGRLSLEETLPIIIDSLEGMEYAHEMEYVHRDIKPQNILLQNVNGKQIAKIGDFGMAKNFNIAGFSGMTVTGSYGGTPPFMPREQVINFKYVKPVTDVWALGATFYNLLTGFYPLDFGRGQDHIKVILNGKPTPIRRRRSDIPTGLAFVIDRSLKVKIQDRYQDAGEMLAALRKAI